MNKRIFFTLFVLIGSIAVAISINYSFGIGHIAEYVALFTSVSTAIYAILAQPKQRTEPFLRITPHLITHGGVFIGGASPPSSGGLNISIENIGYSIAKEIELRCKLVPDTSIPLENGGIFKHPSLAPREKPVQYQVVKYANKDILLSQKLTIETSYMNEDDKRQKPTKMEVLISGLERD
jgi:hypothetical protein